MSDGQRSSATATVRMLGWVCYWLLAIWLSSYCVIGRNFAREARSENYYVVLSLFGVIMMGAFVLRKGIAKALIPWLVSFAFLYVLLPFEVVIEPGEIGLDIAPTKYGMATRSHGLSGVLSKMLHDKHLVAGGCFVTGYNPQWQARVQLPIGAKSSARKPEKAVDQPGVKRP